MTVRKYKIVTPTLPAVEIDPQGEYTFRDPETGAAALLAPTREGDALIPLLGGFGLEDVPILRAKLEVLGALGRDGAGRLTVDGLPVAGDQGAPPPARQGAASWGPAPSSDTSRQGAASW